MKYRNWILLLKVWGIGFGLGMINQTAYAFPDIIEGIVTAEPLQAAEEEKYVNPKEIRPCVKYFGCRIVRVIDGRGVFEVGKLILVKLPSWVRYQDFELRKSKEVTFTYRFLKKDVYPPQVMFYDFILVPSRITDPDKYEPPSR